MSTKIGILGGPRIGIALIWFLPASPGEERTDVDPVSPEEVAYIRGLTGLEPRELLARLQDLAAAYARDPDALRAEILRATGGDEIAAESIVQLIRASEATDDDDDEDDEEGGQVIDFARPDHRNEADEEEDDEPPR